MDRDLAGLLDQDRPLLVVARAGGSTGRAACRKASQDLTAACASLAARFGVDFGPCLPDEFTVAEWLRVSTYTVWSDPPNGQPARDRSDDPDHLNDSDETDSSDAPRLLSRFLVLDFRPHLPLVTSLAATAAAGRADDHTGPATSTASSPWEAALAHHLRAGLLSPGVEFAGVYATRFDRLARSMWGAGTLLNSMSIGLRGPTSFGEGQGACWPRRCTGVRQPRRTSPPACVAFSRPVTSPQPADRRPAHHQ